MLSASVEGLYLSLYGKKDELLTAKEALARLEQINAELEGANPRAWSG